MTLEIRPAEPPEMDEFVRVASTNLAFPAEWFRGLPPDRTLCAFVDGKLATSYGAWPLHMQLNGRRGEVAGVTMVGTLSPYRRQGHLRAITETHLRRLHEQRAEPVAALYASLAAIYQRFGYGIVSSQSAYRVEPRYVDFVRPLPVSGRLRESSAAELPLLERLYGRFMEPRTGYLERDEVRWRGTLFPPSEPGATLNIVVYEEAGGALGYAVYEIARTHEQRPGPYQRVTVRDFVWLSPSAYQALWESFARFDLASEISCFRLPTDDPLPHLIHEPRMLQALCRDGLVARIVDVERALPLRRYDSDGSLAFRVLDDLCPWNKGVWELQAEGGESRVRRSERAAQITLPVSTLAMLFFGQISATQAAVMGRLDAGERDKLPAWDAVMATAFRPFCADFF
jgi:predicted acetyltransferase